MSFFSRIHTFILLYCKKIYSTHILQLAASLSYSTLLTLVPFLIVVAFVISPFPIFKNMETEIQNFVLNNFVSNLANTINEQITFFVSQVSLLKVSSIIALIFLTLLMMMNIANAFNSIWQIKFRYHFAIEFLIHGSILIISPFIFCILLLLAPYLTTLEFILGNNLYQYINYTIILIIPYLLSLIVFTLFNWLLPSTKVPFRYAIIAGFVTSLLFECAKSVFSIYLNYFNVYKIIYGTLATIPFF